MKAVLSNTKRFLAAFLAVAMVFTGVPGAQALGIDAGVKSVQAAESIGEGFIKTLW